MEMVNLFTTPFWKFKLNFNFDKAAKSAYEIQKNSLNQNIELSNRYSYHSEIINPFIFFADVMPLLHDKFSLIAKELNCKLAIEDSWVNINKTGSYNVQHYHPNATVSAVLYIKTPKNSGEIVFHNPTPQVHYPIQQTKNLFKLKEIIMPSEGDLLIFPSYLPHSVERNNSTDDRISLAINLKMTK